MGARLVRPLIKKVLKHIHLLPICGPPCQMFFTFNIVLPHPHLTYNTLEPWNFWNPKCLGFLRFLQPILRFHQTLVDTGCYDALKRIAFVSCQECCHVFDSCLVAVFNLDWSQFPLKMLHITRNKHWDNGPNLHTIIL
jgi:hypothetical protein